MSYFGLNLYQFSAKSREACFLRLKAKDVRFFGHDLLDKGSVHYLPQTSLQYVGFAEYMSPWKVNNSAFPHGRY